MMRPENWVLAMIFVLMVAIVFLMITSPDLPTY
jgi:TRAP-type C4-dicarboxylate transport system permease small subunit